MPDQVFELAILLSLKDAASGRLDHVRDRLRATGKEGKATLQSFEELRKGLKRDLVIGGIGVAGLTLFGKGVKASGDYQASLTDLRVSITELNRDGTINLTQLGDQMNRFDRLGMKLGNALPGSTQDLRFILFSLASFQLCAWLFLLFLAARFCNYRTRRPLLLSPLVLKG